MHWCTATLVTALLAVTASGSLDAQGTTGSIHGRVRTVDGSSLADATVRVLETNLVTVSDAGGRFALDRVPVGAYTVRIETQSHRPLEHRGVAISSGSAVWLGAALEPGSPDAPPTVAGLEARSAAGDLRTRFTLRSDDVSELPADDLRDVVRARAEGGRASTRADALSARPISRATASLGSGRAAPRPASRCGAPRPVGVTATESTIWKSSPAPWMRPTRCSTAAGPCWARRGTCGCGWEVWF